MPTEYFHIHRTVGFIIAFYKEEPSLNSILSQLKPLQTLAPYFYKIYFHIIYRYFVGRDNSVGIATGYGLDGRDRISVGARFSAPVQTGPGAHPASCTVVTRSFPGVKSGRGVTLTPHSLLVPWSWKGRAIPLPPYGLYGLYRASVPLQGCNLPFLHFSKVGLPFFYTINMFWDNCFRFQINVK